MSVGELDEKDKTIKELIRDSPGGFVGTKTVADELDMSTNGASYRLKQLDDDGHLESKQLSRDKAWYIPEMERTVAHTPSGGGGHRGGEPEETTRRVDHSLAPAMRTVAGSLSRLAGAIWIVGVLALLSFFPAVFGFISPDVTLALVTATWSGWLLHVAGALALYAAEEWGVTDETPYHDKPARIWKG